LWEELTLSYGCFYGFTLFAMHSTQKSREMCMVDRFAANFLSGRHAARGLFYLGEPLRLAIWSQTTMLADSFTEHRAADEVSIVDN